MAFFEFDEKDAKGGFEPIPAGEYEVICEKAEVKQSAAGNDMINMQLVVRDDVQQEGQGRKLFNNLTFTEKTKGIVAGALKAFGAEHGQKFDTIEEMRQFFIYKPVRVNVNIENSEQYGAQNRVKFFKQTETGKPAVSEDPFADDSQTIDVTDADLPF